MVTGDSNVDRHVDSSTGALCHNNLMGWAAPALGSVNGADSLGIKATLADMVKIGDCPGYVAVTGNGIVPTGVFPIDDNITKNLGWTHSTM